VNSTLMLAFWRQRLTSPVRMAVLAMFWGMPLLPVAFVRGAELSVLGNGQYLVLTLGAGMIGQDVSSGVLQLLYARPVRRPEYVTSRWLAVAIAGVAVSLLQIAIACGLMAARGAAPPAEEVTLVAVGRLFECLGLAAVLALLSSLVGGLGDLGLYLLAYLGAGVVSMAGQAKGWPWLDRIGVEIAGSLMPTIDLPRLLASSPLAWFPIVSYASTVVLCLALAIVVVNRKELSYASG
jgi:ABC-type transport system involved in multi-copper enzyme maturation permease subunit